MQRGAGFVQELRERNRPGTESMLTQDARKRVGEGPIRRRRTRLYSRCGSVPLVHPLGIGRLNVANTVYKQDAWHNKNALFTTVEERC